MNPAPAPWFTRWTQRRSLGATHSASDQRALDEVFARWGVEAPRVLVEHTRKEPACLPSLSLPGGGRIVMPAPVSGADGIRFFQLLHEAAHCLVHAQRSPFPFGFLDDTTTASLNDWVLGPLHQSLARDAFVERWADAWAALVMRGLGSSGPSVIERVAAERLDAAARPHATGWSFVHDTHSVLRAVLEQPAPLLDEPTLRQRACALAAESWWDTTRRHSPARAALSEAAGSPSPEPWLRESTLAARRGSSLRRANLEASMKGHPVWEALNTLELPSVSRRDVDGCAFEALVACARPSHTARTRLLASPEWAGLLATTPGFPPPAGSPRHPRA